MDNKIYDEKYIETYLEDRKDLFEDASSKSYSNLKNRNIEYLDKVFLDVLGFAKFNKDFQLTVDNKNISLENVKTIDDVYEAIFNCNREQFVANKALANIKKKEEYEQ